MKMKYVISPLVLATLITGCENPMKTMSSMKNTTEGMSKYVNNTNVNSAHLEMLMSQGQTSDFRDKQFELMVNEKDFNGKTDYAAKLMYSMEFQIWSDTGLAGEDMLTQLERVRQESIIELAKKIDIFYANDFLDELKGTESDNDALSFFAISAALHRLNPKQIVLRKNANIPADYAIDKSVQEMTRIDFEKTLDIFTQTRYPYPTETMLDMLVQGLLKANEVNVGHLTKENLKPFEEEVLKEQLKFKRLIEARFKFFPATALARMSKIDDGNIFKKDITKLKMLFKPWTPTFLTPEDSKNMNTIQIAYLNEIMAHALKAKHILEALGEQPKLDSKVIKIYKNMDLSSSKVGDANRDQVAKLEEQIKELLD